MKRRWLAGILPALLLIGFASCSKSSGGGGSKETQLTVTLTPAVNAVQPPSLPDTDGSFPLNIAITSAIPSAGVNITVKAKVDGSSTNYFDSGVISTTSAQTNVKITGTPQTSLNSVTVTVTSKSSASNTWTGSYKYYSK